jgi:type I restriction enzyme S subunit
MSFPRYPAYKDSGVEWLGEVPAHWKVMPLVRDIEFITSGARGWAENYSDDGDLFIRIGNLTRDSIKLDLSDVQRVVVPAGSEVDRTQVREGDVLFSITAYLGSVAVVPPDLGKAFVSQHVALVRPTKRQCMSDWIGYVALSHVGKTHLETTGYGGTKVQLSLADVTTMPVPVPPVDEQSRLVDFLDLETAKIDYLVAEQEQLISLLKEKRQAVISHAVTKGLDPSVPMKDSGVEWLGSVPTDWTVMPIRLAARLESGHTPSRSRPDWWLGCTIPWFSLADVWQIREAGRDVVYETKEMVSELGLANSSARLLPKGTVMLSRTASVGFSAIMGVDMATTQDFANWVCGPTLTPNFLLETFKAMKPEFNRMMMGSTHNTIYMPDIQAFRFALPSMSEQLQIVAHARAATAQSDALIAEAQAAVSLLTERRSALISAAVTGQIDVRSLATAQAAA